MTYVCQESMVWAKELHTIGTGIEQTYHFLLTQKKGYQGN